MVPATKPVISPPPNQVAPATKAVVLAPPPSPAPPVLRDISPNAYAADPIRAQALVNAGKLVGEGPPVVAVPTLSGDIMYGFGYFSNLPIGSLFTSLGRTYRITNRVYWSTGGGTVPNTVLGGDLVLHTCLPNHAGSTFTWAALVN